MTHLTSLNTSNKIVTENPIGDPFLGAIHNIMFSIRGFLCRCSDTCDIRTCKSFSDSETYLLLPAKDLLGNFVLPGLIIGKLKDGCWRSGSQFLHNLEIFRRCEVDFSILEGEVNA